jgi:hypothetical protein
MVLPHFFPTNKFLYAAPHRKLGAGLYAFTCGTAAIPACYGLTARRAPRAALRTKQCAT